MADNLLLELLKRASTPLVPKIQEGYDALANLVDDPNTRGDRSVGMSRLQGGLAGALQGVGNVASGMTSPLGIAGLVAGGAAAPEGVKAALMRLRKPTAGPISKLPSEFIPVGSEPPVTPPSFPNPLEHVYRRILQNKGRSQ